MAGAGSGAIAGATTGLLCGPGAVICSPIGAIIGAGMVSVVTDAAINTVDEKLYREELRKEILDSINDEKKKIKNEYISVLEPKIKEVSENIINKYKEIPIKERKKIKENL